MEIQTQEEASAIVAKITGRLDAVPHHNMKRP